MVDVLLIRIVQSNVSSLGSLVQLVVAIGEWVSTRQISRCILCSKCAPSFCLDSLQSRTGCYLSWVFYVVWTKEHSILRQNVSTGAISSHADIDSNVHHNTTKVRYGVEEFINSMPKVMCFLRFPVIVRKSKDTNIFITYLMHGFSFSLAFSPKL